eukprot:3527568-Lingulodinium_polyedra.AAC.1
MSPPARDASGRISCGVVCWGFSSGKVASSGSPFSTSLRMPSVSAFPHPVNVAGWSRAQLC